MSSSAVDEDIVRLCRTREFALKILHHDDPARLVQSSSDGSSDRGNSSTHRDVITLLRANESCQCTATVCVRDAILSSIDADDLVYLVIKDERSFCLTSYADRIFAAGQPLKLCSEHAVPHHPVVNWSDCARLMQGNTRESTAAQARRQARLHRMDAIKTE